MTDRHGRPRVALVSATVSLIALIGGWTYAAALQPAGIDWSQLSISTLAAQTTPHRWAMTTAFLLTGLGYVTTAATLPTLRRPGRILLAVAGVATMLVAAFPLPAAGEGSLPHGIVAGTAFVALAMWPWWLLRSPLLQRGVTIGFAVLVASLPATMGTPAFGAHERLVAGVLAAWPWVNAVALWWTAGHRMGEATEAALEAAEAARADTQGREAEARAARAAPAWGSRGSSRSVWSAGSPSRR